MVIKLLKALASEEKPRGVALLVAPDELSALVVLANLARPGFDNVRIPFTAGSASLALYAFCEADRAHRRAVIG
jgi:hypothetical protein